jgi:hypothetical protein
MSEELKSESARKNEDWMNSKWRPAMGWMYMLVCTSDFVIFPILWSLIQVLGDGKVETQWSPITLQGAGLFHMAMGAILGIAAYGRTQEKLGGANNGGAQLSSSGFTAPSTPPAGFGSAPGGFSSPAPVTNSFGSQPLAGGSGVGSIPTAPVQSWGTTPIATTASGKKVVPDEPQPPI